MLLARSIQAFGEPRIETYVTDRLATRVSMLLRQSYIMAGFKVPEADDLAILTAKLTSDLFESYRFLTYGEVSLCFELGIKGEYGDFMGLNMRTFSRWLKCYKTSDFRYRQVMERDKRMQAALPPVSEAYNREREDRMLQNAFRHYRAGYPLDQLLPARVYRILQGRKLIADSPADKRSAMDRFARWKPAGMLPMDEETRLHFVKTQAMTALLRRYFDRLVQEGVAKLPL